MASASALWLGGRNHPEFVTEEHLSCGLCRGAFKQPKILQCGHVFCLRCLEQYWGTGPNGLIPLPDGMRPPYSGHHGNSSVDNPCRECGVRRVGLKPPNATCFTCGVEAKLPVTGLHSLPNYIFGNTQIDRLLRRHNDAPTNGIDRRMVYNIPDYRKYGQTMTASFPLPQPHWHGWSIPR